MVRALASGLGGRSAARGHCMRDTTLTVPLSSQVYTAVSRKVAGKKAPKGGLGI